MKRVFVALLTSTLVLCGCENKAETGLSSTSNNNNDVIKLNPAYVAIDDENIKMEVTSVNKEVINAGMDSQYNRYNINFTLTNKTDKYCVDVGVAQGDGYIGPYAVDFANPSYIKPGKINDSASFSCWDARDGAEHITSLKDLLDFNGTVTVQLYEEKDGSFESHDVYSFEMSLEDAKH